MLIKTEKSSDNFDTKNDYVDALRNEEDFALVLNTTVIDDQSFSDLIVSNGSNLELKQRPSFHSTLRTPGWMINKEGAAAAILSQTGLGNPDDLLASLAAEYGRALLGHETDNTFDLAIHGVPSRSLAPVDPFLDSSPDLLDGSLLQDLLGEDLAINTILSDLDQFNTEALFAEVEPQEILRLLAPGDTAILPDRKTGLLTQREHHMISLDSYLPILGTTLDKKKD
ncbi:TagK domain-containing protein [Glaciimonas sp. Gout2]|uniref:TagK domain-containing protein n=1 Tax=unclassified Glaciimonas TaxID=2644401 RepID=UPI002B2225FD|nr:MULTISPECIES: TagK domain-containing protein [unclassified Glaciimonas]MEB0014298.1 TagK domain-containing protein [Glaciimonas sp. Cout2]MEB0084945.1 TagK domain-containing protein [Glaciimonas sp. Gout2]